MSQKFFYNKVVTRNQAIALAKKSSEPQDFKDYVWNIILAGSDYDVYRKEIYCDYIINIYKFCLLNHFSAEKVSTLLSIAVYIFNESNEKKLRFNESFDLLKDLINLHEIQREPYYMGIFSAQEKNDILKYFRGSFYRHYTLYEVAMTKSINYKISTLDKLEPAFPHPVSLSEGEVVDPARIPQLAMFVTVKEEEGEKEEAQEENQGQEVNEENAGHVHLQQNEEEKEAVGQDFVKTPEDLKLEEALDQRLKTFYSKVETNMNERSEELIGKLEAKGGKAKKK